MIPYILAAVGGYLIGDSLKGKQYAEGGMANGGYMAKGGGVKNSSILQALSGFNQGQTLNGIAEILGFSNYRFGKYATESQMKSIERGLKENMKSGYVKEGGVGYQLTEKGARYLNTIPYEKREKGGYLIGDSLKGKQYAEGGMMAKDGEIEKRLKFVNDYYKSEVEYAKKHGNWWGFTQERITKGYYRDLKQAQKGKEFDNFLLEEAYQVQMNNKILAEGG